MRVAWIAGAFCLLAAEPIRAQPSGGPYGALLQNYALPKALHLFYYVAPDGSADAAGTTVGEPTTLESALSRVVTGDAIVMRGADRPAA